jgi:hypothetical protein
MVDIAGYPYFEVEFTKQGTLHDENQVMQVLDFLSASPVTDLLIISHGWNNDMEEARALYRHFFACMRKVMDGGFVSGIGARQFAVLGVLWPSKKFAEEDLTTSGAAGASSPVSDAFLLRQLDDLKGVFDKPDADALLEQAKRLVPQLGLSPSAQRTFADLIRSLPEQRHGHPEDASDRFFTPPGDEIMRKLSRPALIALRPSGTTGGAVRLGSPVASPGMGGAAGLGQIFSGMKSAARNLLNYTTYYQMKERAGTVGSVGVNAMLRALRAKVPTLKLHLIGHSFGGRLVTAAADGAAGESPLGPNSLTLLQAAFSHNGFAQRFDQIHNGFFRQVVTQNKVSGPIVITCTQNDAAVGLLYPLASLIAGQNASKLGDANDPYGGIGRNGAQHTPEVSQEATSLQAVGNAYPFQAGKLYNLNADACITGHSDVCKDEVAYAVLAAVAVT